MLVLKSFSPSNLYRSRKIFFHILLRPVASRGILLTTNDRKLAAFRNKHFGQRAFIIGNGPSLKINDLDRLKGEITFASNKIYLAFEETAWRPTYYAAEDILFVKQNYNDISRLKGFTKFSPFHLAKYAQDLRDTIKYFLINEDFYPQLPRFSFNALKEMYGGGTVTYTLIQLACFMGIREIFLLGIDFHYNDPKRYEGTLGNYGTRIYDATEQEISHFHPDYLRPGEKGFEPNLHLHEKAYLAAQKALNHLGGHIYNTTRGGKLEIFPRIEFDTLFRIR